MSKEVNKHGLSRDIPDDIRRFVRQRDGFGCVHCGRGIYQYDHFDPEFSEATHHHPDGIILLCTACHGKKTKGLLSRETISRDLANPRCEQDGFSFEAFDVGTEHPEFVFGSVYGTGVRCFLRVFGDELFSILPPEAEGAPFRLNAKMANDRGEVVFEIRENEWRIPSDNWDTEQIGKRIIIRNGLGDIALTIRSEPPTRIVVEQLNMQWRGTKIEAREGGKAIAIFESGSRFETTEAKIFGTDIGVDIDESGIGVGLGGSGGVFIGSGTMMNSGDPRPDGQPFSPIHIRPHS
jgi:hypothetical protein